VKKVRQDLVDFISRKKIKKEENDNHCLNLMNQLKKSS